MPVGLFLHCGGVCDAILITESIGALGRRGGGGGVYQFTHLNLPFWFQADTRIDCYYMYECFMTLDRQLWDVLYCRCAEYYMKLMSKGNDNILIGLRILPQPPRQNEPCTLVYTTFRYVLLYTSKTAAVSTYKYIL